MIPPQFILSRKKVIEQYNKAKAMADIVSYSAKTNQEVSRILEKETDSMFSLHFENEKRHLKEYSRVIFLAQGWDGEKIKLLYEQGVRWFVVDNEQDLHVLVDFLEKNNLPERIHLLLRLKIRENTLKTERYFVFGMSSEVINKRIRELKNNQLAMRNIEILGIHFHRKTQNMAEWNYRYELSKSLTEETLNSIGIINIGGGLPAEYANTNTDVVPAIVQKIEELRQWLNEKNIRMMIEPGRFIAAPSVRLETTIIGIHEQNIIVNASVYNSDMDAVIVPVKLLVEQEFTQEEARQDEMIKPYVIKGITPCSMDLFRYRVYLKEPKVGERLVFLNAGAYNFTTEFCDLDKIKTVIVE